MEIFPFESVGDLRFGDSRQSIRGRLVSYESFRKDVGENETDAYDRLGMHLYFDDRDQLELVELFHPASPSFRGIPLLGRPVDEVESDLRTAGYNSQRDDIGLQCDSAGIGVTVRGNIVEGVAVFRRGYYDG